MIVCDSCYQASCWQGVAMCSSAPRCGTFEIPEEIVADVAEKHPGRVIVAFHPGSSIDLDKQDAGSGFVPAPEIGGWLELRR